MEISQSDRNKLREAQHRLEPNFAIGRIVEHKIQNPRQYKQLSRVEQGHLEEELIEMPKVTYKSQYYDHSNGENQSPLNSLPSIREALEPSLPIDPKDAQANMWLNMDKIEIDKLEWMTSKADNLHRERIKGSTRFDHHGRAVVLDSNKTDEETTHDISSLVSLLDSTYEPQVTYALNVIGRIADLAIVGYYDGSFDDNIHDILLKNCLLRVRRHVDSTSETICQSAVKCLRALLCNTRLDEVVLDRVHTLYSDNYEPNTWLFTTEDEPSDFTIEMTDNECVAIDAIAALLKRTDLLARFYYLLSAKTEKFILAYGEYILDILIRVVRHSRGFCLLVIKEAILINLIIDLFLPASITTRHKRLRHLSVKALKLLRIIAQAGSELELRDQKHNPIAVHIPETIVEIVTAYFFIDINNLGIDEREHLFKLHIESLKTVKVLSKFHKFHDHIKSILALGRDKHMLGLKSLASLKSAQQMEPMISLEWQYAAHLIDVTGYFAKKDMYLLIMNFETAIWDVYIHPILCQWLNDLVKTKIVPHLDVSIAVATAIEHHKHRMSEKNCKIVHDLLINHIVSESESKPVVKDNLLKALARSASNDSSLPGFSKETGKLRDPIGLPSYGCLNFNTSVAYDFSFSPVFGNNSPFILLDTIITHLIQDKTANQETLKPFVDEICTLRYIRCATAVHKAPINYENQVQRSVLAQFEVKLICKILLLLRRYYMMAEKDRESKDFREPIEFGSTRAENYGNICYYTMSVMSLINSKVGTAIELKDQLLQEILLNFNFQARVGHESFLGSRRNDSLEPFLRNILDQDQFTSLSTTYLNILLPVYMSSSHPNRYWIFQPLIDFYRKQTQTQTNDVEATKKESTGEYFESNTIWRHVTGELASCKDEHIISAILRFNVTMMAYSPAYAHCVVKPNLEDCLCIIGSLFLNDDIFLKEEVSTQLALNLRIILGKCLERTDGKFNVPFKDAAITIKPLNIPLWNFFEELVNQFEAVSYGDEGFANFLLLFLTPRSDKVFRKKLFQEKADTCLRQMKFGPDGFFANPDIISEEREKDPEIKAFINRAKPYVIKGTFIQCYIEFHGK